MQVITFSGFVPPPRFDALAWTEVRIEEGPTEAGPWTQIDVIALLPVDADPADPASRSFTTELASDGELWYRIIFADLSGDVTLPTAPLLNAVGISAASAGGPCETWITADDVTDCCSTTSSSGTLEWAAQMASDILFELSGHRYSGVCEATVRPCADRVSCWTPNLHWRAADCACRRLSSVRLAGYPVREILEVVIDDTVIDPYDYRLDRSRELVRLNGDIWPSCQRLDLDSGEGTFFVTYAYGVDPPLAGKGAAAQLACQIAEQCPGADNPAGDCDLPEGTVRMTRQGLTIDTQQLGLWLLGSLRTGMPLVDIFLSAYGAPKQRRTALLVPEQDPWPLRVD